MADMSPIVRHVRREVETFSCLEPELAGEIDKRAGDREIVCVSHSLTPANIVSVVLVTLRDKP